MKTQLLVITIFFLTIIVYGQQSKNLSEQMWERVQPCYSMFEDYDEDGKIDYDELIDDSKNGYLKISGSYPTCGCSCTHTVGAYKGNDGKYTFVEEEEWTCSWTKTISSNKDLSEIFPNNFGINTFIPRAENTIDNNVALFYLDIEIPRVGTDTEVSIKVIPFGLYVENDGILSFGYSESEGYSNCVSLYGISSIASEVNDEKTFEYIIDGKYDKISTADMLIINKNIGNDYGSFSSFGDLRIYLIEIKRIYDLYSLIEHEKIILGWDREKSKFYIKSKGNHSKQISFKEFLLGNPFWSPIC